MQTQKAVAVRIQQLCAEKGYTINSLARKSGIPPTTLKNIYIRNEQKSRYRNHKAVMRRDGNIIV